MLSITIIRVFYSDNCNMERRIFLTTTSALSITAIAGCLGGGNPEPASEIISDPPSGIAVSDISTRTDSSELTGEGLIVTGTLENTRNESVRVPRIDAVFYDADEIRLDDNYNFGETSNTIAPGERVRFEIVHLGDPTEVARFTLAFAGSTPSSGTPTETETPTPTPEPVNESFSDDFEAGDIRTSTQWSLNLQDKQATQQKEADAQIMSESAPDGGSGSLSIAVQNGGRAVLTSSEQFRWDAPWLVEGMFKPQVRNNRFAYTRIGLFGSEVLLDMDFSSGTAGITGQNESVNPIQENIGEWQDGVWYAYDCEYDGDSRYQLTVWDTSQTRPTSPTAVTTGRTLSDTEMAMMIRAYAGGDITVNHAFIRFTAGEALE
jgi:hypothetical protein